LPATGAEVAEAGRKRINLAGGAELFVSAETSLTVPLPATVEGSFLRSTEGKVLLGIRGLFTLLRVSTAWARPLRVLSLLSILEA
jgi:hypothetical protein